MLKKLYKSYGYKALHLIVLALYAIFLIPALLYFWDLQVYGKWIAIYSFFNLIQVLELGHAKFIGNEFNQLIHLDIIKAKALVGGAIRFNFVIGILQIGLVYLFYAYDFFRYFFDDDINRDVIALVLAILFGYRFVIGSYRGLIVKLLNPFGLIYKSFQFALMEKILEFVILVSAAAIGFSLIELAIIWFISKTCYSVIIMIELRKLLPEYYPFWNYGSFSIGAQNFRSSIYYSTSTFLDRLSNDGINLFVSAIVGTTFLPLFSATKTLVNFGSKLSELLLAPINPEMITLWVKGKRSRILDVFNGYWFATAVILIPMYTIGLFFLDDFFVFWTSGKLIFSELLFGALAIIYLVRNYGFIMESFFVGITKTKVIFSTSVLRAAIMLGVIFMFREEGLSSILAGLFFSELFLSAFWLPYWTFKHFKSQSIRPLVFFGYLIGTLWLAILFYMKQDGKPLWLLLLLFIPVLFVLRYQYSTVTISTKEIVVMGIQKLTSFVSKKK
ncbi:hypothetical protein [Luteirhabdus pelagi]|uniref:hypothetical protein n=1 Tax=Luteirhabdus pelagi TaxID=2792783 RepID=UPI00193995C1|nr:hypothetical protein [Luteirhabdus pelagi]